MQRIYLSILVLAFVALVLLFSVLHCDCFLPQSTTTLTQGAAGQSESCFAFMTISVGGSYNQERWKELGETLQLNANLDAVCLIHVISESLSQQQGDEWLNSLGVSKASFEATSQQPTLKQLFSSSLNRAPDQSLAVVLNADIELDAHMLGCALALLQARDPKTVITLTRHPHPTCPEDSGSGARRNFLPNDLCTDRNRNGEYVNSADVFVLLAQKEARWKAEVEQVLSKLDYSQNHLGSENRLVYEFERAQFGIENPCKTLRVYHRHCSVSQRAATASKGSSRIDAGRKGKIPRTSFECQP